MLSRKYSPETICVIIDEFASAIYTLDKTAHANIKLEDWRNEMYGRIHRNKTPFTKAQQKRLFIERDFDLSQYIQSLNITQFYVHVIGFPVNAKTGQYLDMSTPFGLHEQEDNPLDKAQHNLIVRYHAALMISLLADVLNQYLTIYLDKFTIDELEYRESFADKEIKFLNGVQYDATLVVAEMMNKMASLALYTDYEKELVKRIVSTKFLYLTDKNEPHHCTSMNVDGYINHEYPDSFHRSSHAKIFREQILSKLSF